MTESCVKEIVEV